MALSASSILGAAALAAARDQELDLEGLAAENRTLLIVTDAPAFRQARALHGREGSLATVLCFTTSRGLFVSSRLGPGTGCLDCFEKRWMANLAAWEHAPEQERALQALERHSPDIRSFPVAATTAALAANLAARSIVADGGRCHYVDLLTGLIEEGQLLSVHNCPCGRSTRAGASPRHLDGLATLAAQIASLPDR